MIITILIIFTVVIGLVLAAFYAYDRHIDIPNPLGRVQRPRQFQQVTVRGRLIPTSTLHLPPSEEAQRAREEGDSTEDVVHVFFPGNPGLAEFYIETMESIHAASGGTAHVYCMGHAGQGFLVDQQRLEAALKAGGPAASFRFDGEAIAAASASASAATSKASASGSAAAPATPATTAPAACAPAAPACSTPTHMSDPHCEYMSYPFRAEAPLSLREQIAHKLSVLSALRRAHPRARFVLSGHSMGSHCILEALRAVERVAALARGGAEGLAAWDAATHAECPDAAAAEPATVLPQPGEGGRPRQCAAVSALPALVTRVEFGADELMEWRALVGPRAEDPLSWVTQAQLLFPTVVRIADSPNGDFFVPIFARKWLAAGILRAIALLPAFVKRGLVAFSVSPRQAPVVHAAARMAASYGVLRAIVHMATDEMVEIRVLDTALLRRQARRVLFYFAQPGLDGWVPQWQVDYISALARAETAAGRTAHKVVVDELGLPHAFVTHGSQVVGERCVRWAREAARA